MEFTGKRSRQGAVSVVLQGAIAVSAICGVITMQRSQLQKPTFNPLTPHQIEQQEAFRLEMLRRMPSFGLDNLIAGWTFLNFLQYYGDEPARKQTGFSIGAQFFDVITQRDPRFVDIYLFLSGTISYELGQPELALIYMQRGMDTLSPQITPKAFGIWRFAAIDQLLLLGDYPGAIRSFEMAAKWASQTEEFKPFAPNFQGTANFLKTNPDGRFVRFQAWSVVFEQAATIGDQRTQARAKRELLALGGIERVNDEGKTVFLLPESLRPPQK
jgi:hypothetical protein